MLSMISVCDDVGFHNNKYYFYSNSITQKKDLSQDELCCFLLDSQLQLSFTLSVRFCGIRNNKHALSICLHLFLLVE